MTECSEIEIVSFKVNAKQCSFQYICEVLKIKMGYIKCHDTPCMYVYMYTLLHTYIHFQFNFIEFKMYSTLSQHSIQFIGHFYSPALSKVHYIFDYCGSL